MLIGLCQINTLQADLRGNMAKIVAAVHSAAASGARLAVLPELALVGYCPKDILLQHGFLDAALRCETELVKRLPPAIDVLFGSIDGASGADGPALVNVAVHARNGAVLGRTEKRLIPNYDVFDEARWFRPGEGPGVIDVGGTLVGVTICEDLWGIAGPGLDRWRHDLDPVSDTVNSGASVVVNLSASPFNIGKRTRREELCMKHARTNRVPLVLCNLVGGNDDVLFDGTSIGVSADGRITARAASFAEDMVVFDTAATTDVDPGVPRDDIEAIRKALVLGIRDYAAKSGAKRAIVGLSGGIDSSVVAALAVDAFGAAAVMGVAMPSVYSSPISLEDASELARAAGIDFRNVPIERLHAAALQELTPHFDGRAPDVTEENIQSRLRGLVLMSLANKFGAFVLNTGNKSESAMGYCTLYGDMCGAVAPLADLTKRRVYELAHHYRSMRDGLIPERSILRAPSAELRPDQKDVDSLPPYDVLDDLVERILEKGQGPGEILAAGHEPALVRRVWTTIHRNEFKRRQGPPGIRVTPKAFGSGRRMPITGAFDWFDNT